MRKPLCKSLDFSVCDLGTNGFASLRHRSFAIDTATVSRVASIVRLKCGSKFVAECTRLTGIAEDAVKSCNDEYMRKAAEQISTSVNFLRFEK